MLTRKNVNSSVKTIALYFRIRQLEIVPQPNQGNMNNMNNDVND